MQVEYIFSSQVDVFNPDNYTVEQLTAFIGSEVQNPRIW